MSNYHVLTQALDKKTVNVVYHIPIPNVNNEVGKSYRLALKEWLEHNSEIDTITSICPDISPAEFIQMQNGEIYEIQRSMRFSILSLTPIQKRNELDAEYNALKTEARDKLQIVLEWWILARDVPT